MSCYPEAWTRSLLVYQLEEKSDSHVAILKVCYWLVEVDYWKVAEGMLGLLAQCQLGDWEVGYAASNLVVAVVRLTVQYLDSVVLETVSLGLSPASFVER